MAFTRNTGRTAENVKITLADGTTAWVRVMPRNKGVTLPEGATIDARWHVQYGRNIKHFDTAGDPAWSTKADAATKAQILSATSTATATASTTVATTASVAAATVTPSVATTETPAVATVAPTSDAAASTTTTTA